MGWVRKTRLGIEKWFLIFHWAVIFKSISSGFRFLLQLVIKAKLFHNFLKLVFQNLNLSNFNVDNLHDFPKFSFSALITAAQSCLIKWIHQKANDNERKTILSKGWLRQIPNGNKNQYNITQYLAVTCRSFQFQMRSNKFGHENLMKILVLA